MNDITLTGIISKWQNCWIDPGNAGNIFQNLQRIWTTRRLRKRAHGWTRVRNPRSVHPAAPHHRLTRRLVIPNTTEPFKVIAARLGNSISRLRPISKGTSIKFTRNAGIRLQRRSTRYTRVARRRSIVRCVQFDDAFDWLRPAESKEKFVTLATKAKTESPLQLAIAIHVGLLISRRNVKVGEIATMIASN